MELLETHPDDGALHVNLLDGATIRLGANSQVRLDEFLYDPSSGAGKVTASISKGVARFITGKIKGEGFQVRTPTALIGVRGTDFIVSVLSSGATAVRVISGIVQMVALRSRVARVMSPGQTLGVNAEGTDHTTEVSVQSDPGLEEAEGGEGGTGGGADLLRRSSIPGTGARSVPRTPPRAAPRVAPPPPPPKIGH